MYKPHPWDAYGQPQLEPELEDEDIAELEERAGELHEYIEDKEREIEDLEDEIRDAEAELGEIEKLLNTPKPAGQRSSDEF